VRSPCNCHRLLCSKCAMYAPLQPHTHKHSQPHAQSHDQEAHAPRRSTHYATHITNTRAHEPTSVCRNSSTKHRHFHTHHTQERAVLTGLHVQVLHVPGRGPGPLHWWFQAGVDGVVAGVRPDPQAAWRYWQALPPCSPAHLRASRCGRQLWCPAGCPAVQRDPPAARPAGRAVPPASGNLGCG
jgi:hypothetical protein